jgi:glycosyltransferase involved in cell wall biosynthesis
MLASGLVRIGVDATAVSPAGKGHARTQRHAVEALARQEELELVAFVRDAEAAGLLPVETVVVPERPAILWEQLGLPLRTRRLDAILSWSDRLSVLPHPPTVVWLFESPVHRIEQNRRTGASAYQRFADLLTSALWRRTLRRAAHICFGSQATGAEVLSELPELAGRTSVVYPGLAPGFSPGPAPDRGPYVFHLGSADPRDNTESAIAACRLASVRLLVAGGVRLETGGADVEFLGRVSDEELVGLYRGAAAYLDPALYEGFGYGVLEAMACGAPVVASDRSSIPEVVSDAGLLADPESPQTLAAALRRVLDEPGLAEELRRRGLGRAAEFTWDRTGHTLGDALRRAAAEGAAAETGYRQRR